MGDEKIAVYVKTMTEGYKGDARLFRVDPPMSYTWKEPKPVTSFVIVSASSAFGNPETYIFPADESGEVLDWMELDGSFRGALDHVRALNDAGYSVRITGTQL